MRVLAVTPYYAPEGGGLERYAHAILSRLARLGHEVHVQTFTRTAPPHQTTQDGVVVERRRAPWHLGRTPIDPGLRAHLQTTMDRLRPDVVLAHTPVPFPAEMAYLAARRARVPFIVTYHAGRLRGSTPLLDGLAALDRVTLERSMLAGSHGLIAVGPYVRDNALSAHRARVTIVPPGVDAHFRPQGRPDPDHILFVGPLAKSYRWKGVDVLLRAFQTVRRERPRARLTLVGSGDRLDDLRHGAASDPHIHLAGRLDELRLAAAYRRATVVVLPSTTDAESFGMVLAEANATERPVVASRIGGIPDFVHHGENGLLARPGDPEDLAAQLLEVLRDPERATAMGRRGRLRVERDHQWDDLTARTETVLEDAATRRTVVATA